jgi:hypothetical protein
VGDSTTEQDPVSDSAASLSFGVRLGLSNGKRGLIYKERVSPVEEVDFFSQLAAVYIPRRRRWCATSVACFHQSLHVSGGVALK